MNMKRISLSILLCLLMSLGVQAQDDLTIMTYNIRYNNPGDGVNAWPARAGKMIDFLNREQPDVVCVQEALPDQVEALANGLSGYAYIGRSREKSKKKGEATTIFYKTERVSMREQGYFWLSDESDKAGSVGWDAALPRIVNWGFFRDEGTGKSFYLFNTHFDHKGKKARQQSSKLIVSKSRKISSRYPVVLCGDLNMEPTDANMENFKLAGFTDTRSASGVEPKGPEETCFGFNVEAESGKRIDYIMTRNEVTVKSYSVLTEAENGYYLSDHLPVMVGVEIGNK